MSKIIGNPTGGIGGPAKGAPTDPSEGTTIPNAAKRPSSSVELAPRGGQADAPMSHRLPLRFPANLRSRERGQQGEIQKLAVEANQARPQHEAEQPRRALDPTLSELLANERQHEEAVREQRTQLVHSALPQGGAAMKRLKDRAARQHPSTKAEMWRARLNGRPKPLDGERRKTFEALVRADVMALAKVGKLDPWVAAATMRAAILDGTLAQGILAQDRHLLLDALDPMARHVDRLYERLNMKITDDTEPAFTNIHVLEKPRPLGSGSFNTVFGVKLRNPDGSVFDGVFKPLGATDYGWSAAETGIPRDDPQTAMRNIATVSYAKKLGLDVIADTRLALIDTGRGIQAPDVGLIMERARGKPACQVEASILTRPEVCSEVTKLQLLDHLTGQGDRHAANYFIHIAPNGRAKVTGIDNDQCFGKNLTDPAGIQRVDGDAKRWGFRGTGLPPVVDTEMESAINALTSRDIRSMLGNKLSGPEIQAAIARHQGVKDHIARLRADGRVIEPAQWSDPSVQQLLNARNSYLGRERERALAPMPAPPRRGNNAGAWYKNW